MNQSVSDAAAARAEATLVLAQNALEDGKAVDVRVLPVAHMTTITDYMVVASGRSVRQVKALTERLRESVKNSGLEILGVEGEQAAEWVLVDLGDVIVHLMQAETRDFYQLEKLWDGEPQSDLESG